MPDNTDKEQNKKRDREPDTTASDQNAASSSSGIQRDSSGKPIDTKMQADGTQRNNKISSSYESGAQEREKKVLVTAPEQGTKRPRGDDEDDRVGIRNKMDTGVNHVECEGMEQDVKGESLMRDNMMDYRNSWDTSDEFDW